MDKILSIIIPSYNMEAYLPKCCDSLLIDDKELFEKLDIIIVNDGSRDRTSEIAHGYEARFPSVFRVIDKPNGHYGSCINAALPLALGVFVKVLDADDWFDNNVMGAYLASLDSIIKHHSDVDVIISDYDKVDEASGQCRSIRFDFDAERPISVAEVASSTVDVTMHAVSFRTSALTRIDYKQTEGCIYTDNEWVLAGFSVARKCYYWGTSVYKYLIGRPGQSIDRKTRNQYGYQMIELFGRHLDYCQKIVATLKEDNLQFVKKHLMLIYGLALNVFFDMPYKKQTQRFYDQDRRFAEMFGEERTKVGAGYCILGRTPFRYHYVLAWQKSKFFRFFPLLLFVSYRNILRLIKKA